MSRTLAISGLMLVAVAVGGCTYVINRGHQDELPTAGSLERTEQARASADRMHPACRDSRADRDDQPEGCDRVVRRDR